MTKIQKLSLMTSMLLAMAGCNEKVSPELQQGSTTAPTTNSAAPVEYSFSVENTSNPLLNYKLHKTGENNFNSPCKITSSTALTEDSFGSPSNDISCFFEAEELSLYLGGFNFALKASKNTCEFIGYQPFGFYDRIPGDSSGTFLQVTCTNSNTGNDDARRAADARGLSTRTAAGADTLRCGEFVTLDNSVIPENIRESFSIENDRDLCHFNYKDGAQELCDIGVMTIREMRVTQVLESDGNETEFRSEIVPRTIRCGGAVSNCVKGPTKYVRNDTSRVLEVTQAPTGEPVNKTYNLASPFSQNMVSNKFYANYRRGLANKNIEYGDSQPIFDSEIDNYRSLWSDTDFGKTFEPELLDYFSNNTMFDQSTSIVTADILLAETVKSNKWKAMPLAADPYMGLASKVNPFYTFYCLDNAREIKARIRMVVREWDRVFPANTSDFDYLSDLFRGVNARQDIDGNQVNNSWDPTIPLNDIPDWDDFIPMSRSLETFDPETTIWRPTPTTSYPEGWFNPNNFTNNSY